MGDMKTSVERFRMMAATNKVGEHPDHRWADSANRASAALALRLISSSAPHLKPTSDLMLTCAALSVTSDFTLPRMATNIGFGKFPGGTEGERPQRLRFAQLAARRLRARPSLDEALSLN